MVSYVVRTEKNNQKHALHIILVSLSVLLLLVLGAWWYILLQIVPKIEQWRLPITQEISKQVGRPVHISQIKGFYQGWRPAVEITGISLLDSTGHTGLSLPRLTAQLSLESLWRMALWRKDIIFHRLVLEQPQVWIRRDNKGQWHVAGIPIQQSNSLATVAQSHVALDWLLLQHNVQILNAKVNIKDEQAGANSLLKAGLWLDNMNMQLRTKLVWLGREHVWHLQATPPKAIGQRFHFDALMKQPLWMHSDHHSNKWGSFTRVADWRTWSGEVKLSLPWVNVQSFQNWWPVTKNIQGGNGSLGLNLTVQKGVSQSMALNINVKDVAVRLQENLRPLAFKQLQGLIKLSHTPIETRLAWDGLTFTTDQGLFWPASQASMVLTNGRSMIASNWWHQWQEQWANAALKGRMTFSRVDLVLLNRLADRLPLSDNLRQQMVRLSPQGIGKDLIFNWHGNIRAPSQYRLEGKVEGMSWLAEAERPGLAGASLIFNASHEGGQASISIQQGWVEFLDAFEEPRIPIDKMQAQVQWKLLPTMAMHQPPRLQVMVNDLQFSNADAHGSLQATWKKGESTNDTLGHLALKGRLTRAQGSRVWRYLPSAVNKNARDYVRQSVRSGIANGVEFEVNGPLALFPFKDNQGGLLRITVPVEQVELEYAAGWPVLTDLKGGLVFEGQGMRISQGQAKLGAVGSSQFTLQNINGSIQDLDADDPVLTIEGEGQGPLNDVLIFVKKSPIGAWTGHMLDDASSKGQTKATLALNLPLMRSNETKVKGQLTFGLPDQAMIRLGDGVPKLDSAQGSVKFTQNSLSAQINTRVWGQPVQIQGSTDTSGIPRFLAKGIFNAESFKASDDFPQLAQIASYMNGQTPFTLSVSLARKKWGQNGDVGFSQPEIQISSTLAGMALTLPEPLKKPAEAIWPLNIVHRVDTADSKTDTWLMGLAAESLQFKAEYHRDIQGAQPKVTKGLLQLIHGAAPVSPAVPNTGVFARVSIPNVNVSDWGLIYGAMSEAAGKTTADFDEYLPSQIHFKSTAVTWQQRTLKDIQVLLNRSSPNTWRAKINAQQMAGDIEWLPEQPSNSGLTSPGRRLVARFSHLSVPSEDARLFENGSTVSQVLKQSAASIPALDITVDHFDWRGLPMGKLEIQAVNQLLHRPGQSASTPEWKLTKFNISNADAQLQASGNWAVIDSKDKATDLDISAAKNDRQQAAFNFNVDLINSGGLLNRLGLPQTVKGGKGKLSGQLSWLGSPLSPDMASMQGNVVVAIDEGQFLKVDPGAAKLLGVLSLQSLPRRLALDFRDVFQKGFLFDRIDGDIDIKLGIAKTRNLRMRGVQAIVLMEGKADLIKETQNLKVFVVPEINAGTASLAYAAINPAIGLGTFIAQVLLRKTVVEANTNEFAITGTWAKPDVVKVEKSSVPVDVESVGVATPASQESSGSAPSP